MFLSSVPHKTKIFKRRDAFSRKVSFLVLGPLSVHPSTQRELTLFVHVRHTSVAFTVDELTKGGKPFLICVLVVTMIILGL